MKYLSNWQPLTNEDRHTALLFGFMRHAPVHNALNPWLLEVLGRRVDAEPLSQNTFWPRLPSIVPGSATTEPEIVFRAQDEDGPFTVVVEVKPGYGMMGPDQICREVVDVASSSDASRVACLMIGADLGAPMDLVKWKGQIEESLRTHLSGREVGVELKYASFASLGRAIRDCGQQVPVLSRYADDVLAKLRRKGLLGYDGTPMLDDLDGLTIPNAVEAFNRSIRAAREFFLQLHSQPRFTALGLQPYWAEHRMVRNGGSQVPTQPVEWFDTTVVIALYKTASWDPKRAVFICFDLLGDGREDADLCAGACAVTNPSVSYAFAQGERGAVLANPVLQGADAMSETLAGPGSQWRFARRPWKPGHGEEDIRWTLARLSEAIRIWDDEAAGMPGMTHADFKGISSETLNDWLKWWSNPKRASTGQAEKGKQPAAEIAKLEAELVARSRSAR